MFRSHVDNDTGSCQSERQPVCIQSAIDLSICDPSLCLDFSWKTYPDFVKAIIFLWRLHVIGL